MTAPLIVPQLRFATKRLGTGPLVHYAEQGDPSGEVLVFVHGWPDSWFSFSRILPLLPARYRAYALDQRGFGDSERPVSGYTIDHFAADVVAFLDAVGAAIRPSSPTSSNARMPSIAPCQTRAGALRLSVTSPSKNGAGTGR